MRIAGYAALFNIPDRGGDIIRKGAFAKTAKAGIPLLWQHDPTKRIGYVETIEEDEHGLRIIADVDGDVSAEIHNGSGLSFGYRVQDMQQRRYRELTCLDLIEVSVVTNPMQPQARILATENNL